MITSIRHGTPRENRACRVALTRKNGQRPPAAEVRRRLLVRAPQQFPQLTSREREVLRLLVRDTGTCAIAGLLGITTKTVRNHVSNILVKLPARTRGEACRIGRKPDCDSRIGRVVCLMTAGRWPEYLRPVHSSLNSQRRA